MSRLLKDCMSSCCCDKKQDNICDVIDDLGNVVKSIDCAKKIAKELEKVKKELRAESEAALEKLLNKVNREKWVVGEYKWMPVGSKMPLGWVKVELGDGLTLIQGKKEGTTQGDLKKHSHLFPNESGVWSPGTIFYQEGQINLGETGLTYPSTKGGAAVYYNTADTGAQDNNLAAGKFAELWQFKGVDYHKEQIQKCLEKSIKECLENN